MTVEQIVSGPKQDIQSQLGDSALAGMAIEVIGTRYDTARSHRGAGLPNTLLLRK